MSGFTHAAANRTACGLCLDSLALLWLLDELVSGQLKHEIPVKSLSLMLSIDHSVA